MKGDPVRGVEVDEGKAEFEAERGGETYSTIFAAPCGKGSRKSLRVEAR